MIKLGLPDLLKKRKVLPVSAAATWQVTRDCRRRCSLPVPQSPFTDLLKIVLSVLLPDSGSR